MSKVYVILGLSGSCTPLAIRSRERDALSYAKEYAEENDVDVKVYVYASGEADDPCDTHLILGETSVNNLTEGKKILDPYMDRNYSILEYAQTDFMIEDKITLKEVALLQAIDFVIVNHFSCQVISYQLELTAAHHRLGKRN